MKRILTAVVLIPLVMVLVFLPPSWQWLFTAATTLVGVLAGWEFLGLAQHKGAAPPRIAVVIAIVALFAANFVATTKKTVWPRIRTSKRSPLCS